MGAAQPRVGRLCPERISFNAISLAAYSLLVGEWKQVGGSASR